MTDKITVEQVLTYEQLTEVFCMVNKLFPEAYGYTVHPMGKIPTMAGIQTYVIFANRETSFDVKNAIATIKYHN